MTIAVFLIGAVALAVLFIGLGIGIVWGIDIIEKRHEEASHTRAQRIRALADTIRNRMTDDDWAALHTPPRPPTHEEIHAALALITAEHAEEVAAEQRHAQV